MFLERGGLIFLPPVAFRFQSPLVFIACFKSPKLPPPFFFSFQVSPLVSVRRKVLTQNLSASISRQPIKSIFQIYCRKAPAASLSRPQLTVCSLCGASTKPYISAVVDDPGKTPLLIYRGGPHIHRAYLTFSLCVNTPTVTPLLSGEQLYV